MFQKYLKHPFRTEHHIFVLVETFSMWQMMSAVKYYETPCQHFLIQLYDCNPNKITDFNICQRKGTLNIDEMEIQGFYMMLTVYQFFC